MQKSELCNKLIQEKLVKENDVIRHNYTTYKDTDCIQANNESPTLDTRCDCLGVVVLGNYMPSKYSASRIISPDGLALTVRDNHGTITAIAVGGNMKQNECNLIGGIGEKDSNNNQQWKLQNRIYSSDNSMPSIATAFNPYVDDPLKESLKELAEIGQEELRIRKLTPKECLRLMNVKDEDIELMSEHQTNALLYHIAGDSICSNVLMALLGQLVDVNWEEKFSEIEKRFLK